MIVFILLWRSNTNGACLLHYLHTAHHNLVRLSNVRYRNQRERKQNVRSDHRTRDVAQGGECEVNVPTESEERSDDYQKVYRNIA